MDIKEQRARAKSAAKAYLRGEYSGLKAAAQDFGIENKNSSSSKTVKFWINSYIRIYFPGTTSTGIYTLQDFILARRVHGMSWACVQPPAAVHTSLGLRSKSA
ncbi:hypothetical protein CYMTET_29980 [Cymbomonas tetramitiformis]|uniref:Uncharacterized protein n=1 Tax=Cymbomonas tetramitiformis TaxID=36881 RepID=A0AAE0FJW4_9CHLO|nr:hypothetical protein CYMTET_29980 [Cymbomonas tetramitiformis]